MAEAYCVKCKAKREVKNPEQITLKNGTHALKARAPSVERASSRSAANRCHDAGMDCHAPAPAAENPVAAGSGQPTDDAPPFARRSTDRAPGGTSSMSLPPGRPASAMRRIWRQERGEIAQVADGVTLVAGGVGT